MKKLTQLENGLIHVYAYCLPSDAVFLHKGEFYIKIDDESAEDMFGKEKVFEGHYGCLISEKQYNAYALKESNIWDATSPKPKLKPKTKATKDVKYIIKYDSGFYNMGLGFECCKEEATRYNSREEAKEICKEVLGVESIEEVKELSRSNVSKHYPDEWTDRTGNKRLTCICGNSNPFHINEGDKK